jgi:PAS domain S-box-containing protein
MATKILAPSDWDFISHNLPNGIMIFCPEGKFIYANNRAIKFFGLSSDQLVGKRLSDISLNKFRIKEINSSLPQDPVMTVIKTGKMIKGMNLGFFFYKLKKYKWITIDVIPQINQETNEINKVYAFFHEITERKKIENALSESQRKLTTLIDNLFGMAYMCKFDEHWTMQFVSKGCYELTGYYPIELINNKKIKFAEIIHPDDRQIVYEKVSQALKAHKLFEIEYRIITAQGKEKFVIEHGVGIYRKSGIPILIEGLIEDITEKKIAEKELNEKKLAIIHSINAIVFADLNGNLSYVNKAFLNLLGYDNENEVLGKQITLFYKSSRKVLKAISRLLEKGRWHGEIIVIKKNGEEFSTLLSASLIYDTEGIPVRMTASFIDITEQKELQESLAQKLRIEKTISHISSRFIGNFKLDDAINRSLAEIGNISGASRVYLFRLRENGKIMDNTHEWCSEGVIPQIKMLQNLPVNIFPWWMKKLRKNEVIKIGNVSLMPKEASKEKEILEEQDIKSLLVLPLKINNRLDGFIGIDYTDDIRIWKDEDVLLLRMLEDIFSNALKRKQTEEHLSDSERKFRLLFKNHTAPKLIIDPDTGNILDANKVASRFFNRPYKNLVKMNIRDISMTPSREISNRLNQIKAGKKLTTEFQAKLQNHSAKYIESFNSLVEISGKKLIYAIFFDITEKKKIENQLILLKTAIIQSPESIFITDRESRIIYANPRFYKTSGYTGNEILGEKVSILKTGHHDKEFYKKLWDTILSKKNWYGEILNKKKNGELVWEFVSISPIFSDSNEIINFVAIKQDITERKKYREELIKAKEKAEESDRLKSAFLTNLSHEIRTPMNGILGFLDLLKEPELEESQQNMYIDIVNQSGKRLLSTLNDIIEISKIETGILEKKLEEVNIRDIMKYYYHFFKLETDKKGLKFNIEKQVTGQEAIIFTDKYKLESILSNLIKNAIKFTSNGSITIGNYISNNLLIFYVKDTGCGIPEELRDAIFERFIQADINMSRTYEGSGLGLSIVKAYVEAIGGKIEVQSEINKGSIFIFSIPYMLSDFSGEKNEKLN